MKCKFCDEKMGEETKLLRGVIRYCLNCEAQYSYEYLVGEEWIK